MESRWKPHHQVTAKSGSKAVVVAAYIKARHKVSSLLTSQLIPSQPQAVRWSLPLPNGRRSLWAVTLRSPQSHMPDSHTPQSCQGRRPSAFTKGWGNSFPPTPRRILPVSPAVTNTRSRGYLGITSWIKCQTAVRSLLSHCYLKKGQNQILVNT